MGDSMDSLAYLVNLMAYGICNTCSKYHGDDACPMLLDTNFCGETQIAGDVQGEYYCEQNSYLEEQSICSYQQFQQNQYESLEVDPHSELKDLIKKMVVNNLQFQESTTASLNDIQEQLGQLVSTFHQTQNKMLHDDVQHIALLEVTACDVSLDESPGEPNKTSYVSCHDHELNKKISSECMEEIVPQNFLEYDQDEFYNAIEIEKSLEISTCKCGVCNTCHEIGESILGEDWLMLATTCAKIKENSINVESETRKVDFIHGQPLSITKKLMVKSLINPYNLKLSFTI
jgi:hypothetical protein